MRGVPILVGCRGCGKEALPAAVNRLSIVIIRGRGIDLKARRWRVAGHVLPGQRRIERLAPRVGGAHVGFSPCPGVE